MYTEGVQEQGATKDIWVQKKESARERGKQHEGIIRVMKSRRLRWVGHMPHKREKCVHSFSGETWRKETTLKT
jgi:hypothetical protein